MPHQTPKAVAAIDAGGSPVTLLEIDLPDGTTFRASDAGRTSATAPFGPFIRSWSPITYNLSEIGGKPRRVGAIVTVNDPDRTLTKVLKGEDARLVRGSAARLRATVFGLDEDDWWSRLIGIVHDWKMPEPFVITFLLRSVVDDPLRSDGNQVSVTADDFPTAPESSLGVHIPVVLGVHDSATTNATGLLNAFRISTDGDPSDRVTKPIRYVVSVGRLPNILASWEDGSNKVTLGNKDADWFWEERNGKVFSTLGFTSISDTLVVTVDAMGLAKTATPTPDPTDDSEVIKNSIEQLRFYLAQFVFNDFNKKPDNSSWFDPFADTALNRASWDTAMAYAGRKELFGARAIPSEPVVKSMTDFSTSWTCSYLINELGELGIDINDPHLSKEGIYGQVVVRRSDMRGRLFKLEPELDKQIDGIRNRFFYSEADGDFLAGRTVRDPHRTHNREVEIDQLWSGATEPSLL